jgi:hypothetical protein
MKNPGEIARAILAAESVQREAREAANWQASGGLIIDSPRSNLRATGGGNAWWYRPATIAASMYESDSL